MAKFNRYRPCALFPAVFLLFCFWGCVPTFWIQKYRDMPDIAGAPPWDHQERRTIHEKNADMEAYYVKHYGIWDRPKFHALPVEVDEAMMVERHDADGALSPLPDGPAPGVKLTFVHVSDVQLRDEQVRLYNRKTSKLADYVVPSFEHSPLQEVFDGAAYYAIVQTVNATVQSRHGGDPLRPKFVIHTGDAIDAGVVNELYEFLWISNELKTPWYNALGNHDVGVFGNIRQNLIFVNDPFVDFMTLHSTFNFINMHDNAYQYYPFVNVSPTNSNNDFTLRANLNLYSKYNGFDRLNYQPNDIGQEKFFCRDCHGYYSMEIQARAVPDPGIQMVVLDTGFRFGAGGSLEARQLEWLRRELERHAEKIILVFGHHPISKIRNGEVLKKLLTGRPSAVAYFCGHEHGHQINYHPAPDDGFGIWEIVTDATFAYPQQASLVRVKYEEGLGFVDVYAFGHTLQETYLDSAGSPRASELHAHAALARAGAVEDISESEKRRIDGDRENRYARLKFPYPIVQ